MDRDKLKEIIELMKEADLKAISLKDEDGDLYIEAHDRHTVAESSPGQPVQSANSGTASDSTSSTDEVIEIKCQQIGTFYTQPDENSDETFVNVGDKVETGDRIGLVEAMKMFSDVKIEHSGTIKEILIENGESVEYDQVIMLLTPEGE